MRIEQTALEGLLVIEPKCFGDERGFFLESYQCDRYRDAGIPEEFVQDNHSRSAGGVLRGMHFQVRRPQAQIVTVMRGRIFDVAVDLRQNSKTFKQWFGVELSDQGPRQIYMAPGFAHGFCVLGDGADLHYKVSRFYDHGDEGGLLWSDPEIGIRWPIETPVVAPRDLAFPTLRDIPADRLPHTGEAL